MQLVTPIAGLIAVAQTAVFLVIFANLIDSIDALATAAYVHIAMAVVTLLSVTVFHAPYGRYSADTIVPVVVDTRAAWVLQEMPTLVAVGFHFARRSPLSLDVILSDPCAVWDSVVDNFETTPCVAFIGLTLFLLHYVHRTFVFPFMIQPRSPTPIHVMLLANVYCCFNGTLQATTWVRFSAQLFHKTQLSSNIEAWNIHTTITLAGLFLFVAGMFINIKSDYALVALRKKTAAGSYSIPRGFIFEFISCPNFFGEGVEWLGYTITAVGISSPSSFCATMPTAGLVAFSFFLYTLSNTFPRGVKHHQWYINKFKETYAQLNREAVIPFIL